MEDSCWLISLQHEHAALRSDNDVYWLLVDVIKMVDGSFDDGMLHASCLVSRITYVFTFLKIEDVRRTVGTTFLHMLLKYM